MKIFKKFKNLKKLQSTFNKAWVYAVCQNGTALPPPELFPGVTIYDLKYPDVRNQVFPSDKTATCNSQLCGGKERD